MTWFIVALALLIAVVSWDYFVRGKRGAALVLGVAALVVLLSAGAMQGFDVDGPWSLVALVSGLGLFAASERAESRQSS
jgi:hypothetical protein